MKKLIFITVLVATFSMLAIAQETIVWLNGSKTDAEIIKKKAQIEAKGLKVFVNDTADRAKRHSIKSIASGDEKFDRIFREGRELMDKEDWAKAAAKFNEIVCDCPENKQVDAALYWLAYCYKKQKMYQQANATVERLVKNFPNSSWVEDARVLRYEIYAPRETTVTRSTVSGQNVAGVPTTAPFPAHQLYTLDAEIAGIYNNWQHTPLDREDEIRLAAFQSLLSADPQKGIESLGNLLRSDSKASETLKREILRSFRGSRYMFRSFNSVSGTELTPNVVVTRLNPMLRDTLVKGFQSEPNVKIRTEIIYSIANINDEPSINYLAQLYSSENSKDLKKAIIVSFGSGTYSYFGQLNATVMNKAQAEQTVAGTVSVTTPEAVSPKAQGSNVTSTTNTIATATTSTQNISPVRKIRFDKLVDIVKVEKDTELRRLAFSNVQKFSGWANGDGTIPMLSQMYDSETDEPFKISIIQAFSNVKNNQAQTKLINIAKNDASNKLRLEAIHSLRNSKDPEVLKFLQSLID